MFLENQNKGLGKTGEYLAAKHLEGRGWRVLGRNIRQKFGEIDILAREPAGTLVFTEVKTLRVLKGGLVPEDNLTAAKLAKMRKMAEAFANGNPQLVGKNGWRIDLLAIAVNPDGNTAIRHYENL